MDLLNAIGLDPEIEELIDYVLNDDRWTVEQQLDIAEHLNARGHTIEGIRLGWRLTRELTLNHQRVVRIIFPWPRRAMVEREAEKFGLDPFLVAGLIRQESAFDPHATSRAGAKGLMQLMPSTARSLARRRSASTMGRSFRRLRPTMRAVARLRDGCATPKQRTPSCSSNGSRIERREGTFELCCATA
jgi:soluble lytic murein transglycosylase